MPKNLSFSPKEICLSSFIVHAHPSSEARHV
ncbi:hypothetical protein PS903_04680 [Pseudomonas fluorescens]|nr:hypothetical protein PS903_04680 [Pseudomonas fluorescens]